MALLRVLPARANEATAIRLGRERYLGNVLAGLKKDIANGVDKLCITGHILKDPAAKLNELETKSICLTMVGAALETVPTSIILGIGHLFSPYGQKIQDAYPDGDVWDLGLPEEQVSYVTALYKEILRFYTVHHMGLLRRSI